MKNLKIWLALLALCTTVLVPWTSAWCAETADYVFQNGAIYTMEAQNPKAQAMAVQGRRICYVGDNQGAAAFVGKETLVIDLKGGMLLPGFVDSHLHPTASLVAMGADLQFDSVEQVLAAIKAWADAHPDAPVVEGFGWRYMLFPGVGPNKADLDRIVPDRPVVVYAIDGHSAWVNSKALERAGVDAKTPDPAPGFSYFQRDPGTSEPTGWLVEVPAVQVVVARLNPSTPEAVMGATAEQMKKFAAAGLTATFDAGMPLLKAERGYEGYQKLEEQGRLLLRIVGSYYWNDPAVTDPVGIVMGLRERFNSELVQVRALKINLDGGEMQHTAVMLEPYADRPGFLGDFLLSPALVLSAVLKAQAEGIDTHTHSYGDGATRAYLDAVEAARQAHPRSPSRHTAGHALFLADEEIQRMARLDVTMQTSAQWFSPDPYAELMISILGEEVAFQKYGRTNSILKAGGRLALGTDWPAAGYVSTYRPLDAIQVAMTRRILTQYGRKQFMPVMPPVDECITLDQALKAYTLDAAYVLDLEDRIGSLKVGKLADLVVLEKDLHEVAPEDISHTRILLTMMNGRITYRDEK